jgi:sulfonate transport system ATP-binding protein
MSQISRIPLAVVPSGSPPAPPVVRLSKFNRHIGNNTILDALDLTIAPGEFVALLGRSGSGKTTLLRTLAGLDDAQGQEITLPRSRATVFQDARLLPWKPVWKNVMLGLKGDSLRATAERALREVGLEHRVDAWPLTLSGGEAQRASLARALVRQPELLLLDEPFASLDALTRIRMHALVMSLWRAHRPAVLLVTHDVEEAMALADRILVLEHGRIAAEEIITALRGQRSGVVRALRSTLLSQLGLENDGGVYADMIGREL